MKNSVKYTLRQQVAHGKNKKLNNNTRRNFFASINYFSKWINDKYGIYYYDDFKKEMYRIVDILQEYEQELERANLGPQSIHYRLVGICSVLGVNLKRINKPKRSNGKIYNLRGAKTIKKYLRLQDLVSREHFISFALRVGIRQDEYKHLTGKDFCYDESGKPCVLIRRGKGGKKQKQVIYPEFAEHVKSYFDGSDNRVFKSNETNIKGTHYFRQKLAIFMYYRYKKMCETRAGSNKLIRELIKRFDFAHPDGHRLNKDRKKADKAKQKFVYDMCKIHNGVFSLRHETKDVAISLNNPVVYDRLPAMAVSVFHLSHWRVNVTITNYLNAQNHQQVLKEYEKLNEKTVISALIHTAEKLKVENPEISVGINRLYSFGRWLREEKDIWYFVDFAPTFEKAYSLIEEYKIYLRTTINGEVSVKRNIESICNAINAYADENNLFFGQRFEYKK